MIYFIGCILFIILYRIFISAFAKEKWTGLDTVDVIISSVLSWLGVVLVIIFSIYLSILNYREKHKNK